jgi:hypothetical protein
MPGAAHLTDEPVEVPDIMRAQAEVVDAIWTAVAPRLP